MPAGEGAFELGTDGPSVVLVGVDDSTTSLRAGWYAAGLARRHLPQVVVGMVGVSLGRVLRGRVTSVAARGAIR